MSISSTAEKAELLRSLHVPGDPLIVTNVWDSITARIVAGAPGVKALATASHSISEAHGVEDGEGLDVDDMLAVARIVIRSVDLPVSVDFEKAYATDAAGTLDNVFRLIEEGAAGPQHRGQHRPGQGAAVRHRHPGLEDRRRPPRRRSRRCADRDQRPGRRPGRRPGFVRRRDHPRQRLPRRRRRLRVRPRSGHRRPRQGRPRPDPRQGQRHLEPVVPSRSPRLAELGVSRVSFGPTTMGLTLSHLRDAATTLTARGDYPSELGFEF